MVGTNIDELAQHVQKLAEARVLCVGDVMLDQFVYGSVERVSPEAPIPVLRIDQESTMLGGAGNVLRNLVASAGLRGLDHAESPFERFVICGQSELPRQGLGNQAPEAVARANPSDPAVGLL